MGIATVIWKKITSYTHIHFYVLLCQLFTRSS